MSHETIYQSLYVQGRGVLRAELHQALRSGRAIRKPKARSAVRRTSRIPDMVLISERLRRAIGSAPRGERRLWVLPMAG